MIVVVGVDWSLRLAEPEDFKRLHIELADAALTDAGAVAALGTGTGIAGPGEVWIAADLVRRLAGRVSGDGWEERFTAMLGAVRRFGWCSEDLERIRAHLKRPDPPSAR